MQVYLPQNAIIPGLIWNNLMHTNNSNYSQLLTRASSNTFTPLNTGIYKNNNNKKNQGKWNGSTKYVGVLFSFSEMQFLHQEHVGNEFLWNQPLYQNIHSSWTVKRCLANRCTYWKQGHPSSDLAPNQKACQWPKSLILDKNLKVKTPTLDTSHSVDTVVFSINLLSGSLALPAQEKEYGQHNT